MTINSTIQNDGAERGTNVEDQVLIQSKYLGKGERNEIQRNDAESQKAMAEAAKKLLQYIGEDPERDGLVRTPDRYAEALLFFTKGYSEDIHEVVNDAIFEVDHQNLVLVKNIEIFSMCEHHMVPFMGKIHIGYIPNNRVLGLSKLARITEIFARRLQVQERLTQQVANAINQVLQPKGVAVVVECVHMCMVMRGIQMTTTCSRIGLLQDDQETREEFYTLLNVRQ
ncbi:GTP cyclohydrolase 1 [Aspergillus cristatus]|uniref:GTP cyclohydrolase 1 n=1 Tax=Aspergillus cristatus TaxID=573508 RepID=A0A1E3BBL0_ASPCR|nr:GTP cyclohydrolase 1 [Aspergillus cristatus]